MFRKIAFIFVLLLLSVSTASAQDQSYSAERFDVDIVIQEDGSLLVTETVTFLFVGEPFTFVYRELESERSDGIVNIEARVDGDLWREGTDPGEVEITGDNDIRVEWHLPPTANTSRTFTLQYEMLGVIRQEETADLFRYQPLADEFDYEIGSSTVTVTFPDSAQLIDTPTADEGALVRVEGNQIITQQTNIDDGDETTITARFASGSLIDVAPAWQQRRQAQNRFAPYWIGASALVLLAGIGGLVRNHMKYSVPKLKSSVPQYDPPSQLPPALAGAINGNGAEAAFSNAIATLFDLADRGVVQIVETEDKKWYQKHAFEVQLLKRPSFLHHHENMLLEMLFTEKGIPTDTLPLSKLVNKFSSKNWKSYKEAVQQELEDLGFISQEKQDARKRIMVVGIVLIIIAALIFAFSLMLIEPFGAWPFALSITFFTLSLFYMGGSATVKPLNQAGIIEAQKWQQFFEYMCDLTKDRASSTKVDAFHRYLPYAASYGLLDRWTKWYQKRGGTDLPHYFQTVSASASDGFAAFIAMSGATNAAGGAGGAGGAAGGGGSGAG